MNRRTFITYVASLVGGAVVGNKIADASEEREVLGEMMQKSPAFAAYIERKKAERPRLVSNPMNRAIDHTVNFPEFTVAPGETKTVQMNPQCLFRGELVAARCADGHSDLWMTMLLVGKKLQSLGSRYSSKAIPMRMFAHDGLVRGVEWKLDTIEKAFSFYVGVKNTGNVARRVEFKISGKAVL